MSLRHLVVLRKLSTSRCLLKPALIPAYNSPELWYERFSCPLLGLDSEYITTINNKITSGLDLNNLEIDIFVNIAASRSQDISQLQEAVANLKKFRRTLNANTLLPSTSHALCRLFLDSDRLPSLVNLLENRIDYGIFPDSYVMNLLLNKAIEQDNHAIGSRLAALIMLQEEFGINKLSDNLSLYTVSRYIESKTDFSDWIKHRADIDPIMSNSPFQPTQGNTSDTTVNAKEEQRDAGQDEDEEDEEEAEYIRVPFLRNQYFDNHFDLTQPRAICGKTLSMLGLHYMSQDGELGLGAKCKLLGEVLESRWSDAQQTVNDHKNLNLTSNPELNEVLIHYIRNTEDMSSKPDENQREALLTAVNKLPDDGTSLSKDADLRQERLLDQQTLDIQQLKKSIHDWSVERNRVRMLHIEMENRKKLIEEIRCKKKELKEREEYLYFFDNLKKNSLTRLEYE